MSLWIKPFSGLRTWLKKSTIRSLVNQVTFIRSSMSYVYFYIVDSGEKAFWAVWVFGCSTACGHLEKNHSTAILPVWYTVLLIYKWGNAWAAGLDTHPEFCLEHCFFFLNWRMWKNIYFFNTFYFETLQFTAVLLCMITGGFDAPSI